MNHLICFSGSAYDYTTARIGDDAKRFGVDKTLVYDDRWLMDQPLFSDTRFQFLYTHKGVGNPEGGRGFGWMSWKPTVIADALSRAADGDIILYTDADTYPIADLTALRNGDWNKRDCMIEMGMDEPEFLNAQAGVARFMLFMKGGLGVSRFISEWQDYALRPNCQTFEPSVLAPEHPGFREHRCEQSVFTNLCHRFGLKLYRECCEFGNQCQQDWDLYPQIFVQHYASGPKSLAGSRFRNV
jgi:hypothetical protein